MTMTMTSSRTEATLIGHDRSPCSRRHVHIGRNTPSARISTGCHAHSRMARLRAQAFHFDRDLALVHVAISDISWSISPVSLATATICRHTGLKTPSPPPSEDSRRARCRRASSRCATPVRIFHTSATIESPARSARRFRRRGGNRRKPGERRLVISGPTTAAAASARPGKAPVLAAHVKRAAATAPRRRRYQRQ